MSTLESRRRAKELGPGKNREVDEAEGKRKGEPESTQIQTDQIANSKNNKKQQQQHHHHHHPHPRRQYKGEQDKMRKALRRTRGRRRRKRRKKQNTKTRSKQPSKQAGRQASKLKRKRKHKCLQSCPIHIEYNTPPVSLDPLDGQPSLVLE